MQSAAPKTFNICLPEDYRKLRDEIEKKEEDMSFQGNLLPCPKVPQNDIGNNGKLPLRHKKEQKGFEGHLAFGCAMPHEHDKKECKFTSHIFSSNLPNNVSEFIKKFLILNYNPVENAYVKSELLGKIDLSAISKDQIPFEHLIVSFKVERELHDVSIEDKSKSFTVGSLLLNALAALKKAGQEVELMQIDKFKQEKLIVMRSKLEGLCEDVSFSSKYNNTFTKELNRVNSWITHCKDDYKSRSFMVEENLAGAVKFVCDVIKLVDVQYPLNERPNMGIG